MVFVLACSMPVIVPRKVGTVHRFAGIGILARSAQWLGAAILLAADAPADTREIASTFFIAKSQNKNQVHYALRVDNACLPVGPAPVRPYWLMLEKGPGVTEPLLDREQPAYGIGAQQVDGPLVRVTLRALPARPVVLQTWQSPDGQCLSSAVTTIAGDRARLFNVYVGCSTFGLGIDYLLLTGWRDDGTVVSERIER